MRDDPEVGLKFHGIPFVGGDRWIVLIIVDVELCDRLAEHTMSGCDGLFYKWKWYTIKLFRMGVGLYEISCKCNQGDTF